MCLENGASRSDLDYGGALSGSSSLLSGGWFPLRFPLRDTVSYCTQLFCDSLTPKTFAMRDCNVFHLIFWWQQRDSEQWNRFSLEHFDADGT
jgi:hypothetical protein